MRYTKAALLTFGAGLVLALVVVATETQGLARVASAAMPSAIAALATRASPCVSVATTTSAMTRPAPNVSRAGLV